MPVPRVSEASNLTGAAVGAHFLLPALSPRSGSFSLVAAWQQQQMPIGGELLPEVQVLYGMVRWSEESAANLICELQVFILKMSL